MIRILIPVLFAVLIACALSCHAQEGQKFNLDLEKQTDKNDLADGWFRWGTYDSSMDKLVHSGKNSVKITADESGKSFGALAYQIPAKYKGEEITLEGFMKIKNVKDGFAGLLLRIEGDDRVLEFDNMQSQNITGTRDWQKYSITLKYPEEAEQIVVAGMLVGKGEAWFDNFTLSIDSQDVQTLKEIKKDLTKAKLDKEFDKGS